MARSSLESPQEFWSLRYGGPLWIHGSTRVEEEPIRTGHNCYNSRTHQDYWPTEIHPSTGFSRSQSAESSVHESMPFIIDGLQAALRAIFSGSPEIYSAAWRSFWISSVAVAAAATVGIPLGVWLARREFLGRQVIIELFRAAMALPTVFIGLVCFAMFARNGPLGPLEMLYTPWAIVVGEMLLAFPLIVSLTQGAIKALDERIGETAMTLGAGPGRRFWTYLSEARTGVKLALLTAFSRCVTELGIAMMVGGNLKGRTRTLSTATAMETSKGEFATGLAMGILLLCIALAVTFAISWISREDEK